LYHWDSPDEEFEKHLNIAEHAVHNGINDAVDILITHVKVSLANITNKFSDFQIAISAYGDDYIGTLRAINVIDELVVYSRENREERVARYSKLAEPENGEELKVISSFALKLPEIEAVAAKHDGTSEELLTHILNAINDVANSDASFTVNLQPKYKISSSNSKSCIGAEALLRLTVKGVQIPPSQFIPFAVSNRLISSLDEMVLKIVLQVLCDNPSIPSISVNVEAEDLLNPDFSNNVLELIEMHQVDKTRLELELTETSVINDNASYNHIRKLANEGIKISIDDFGTGQTRFDYLARMPISVIKIDKSLVDEYLQAPAYYGKLLSAINSIGSGCEMDVIAEGIENAEDLKMLTDLGVSKFQGYHFGKPTPIDNFMDRHSTFFTEK